MPREEFALWMMAMFPQQYKWYISILFSYFSGSEIIFYDMVEEEQNIVRPVAGIKPPSCLTRGKTVGQLQYRSTEVFELFNL